MAHFTSSTLQTTSRAFKRLREASSFATHTAADLQALETLLNSVSEVVPLSASATTSTSRSDRSEKAAGMSAMRNKRDGSSAAADFNRSIWCRVLLARLLLCVSLATGKDLSGEPVSAAPRPQPAVSRWAARTGLSTNCAWYGT